MLKTVCTELDPQTWEAHGTAWTRGAKAAGYSGLIVERGLPVPVKEKLNELRFRVVSDVSPYAALATYLKSGEKGLFCPPDFDFADADKMFQEGFVCGKSELPIANLVLPIANIPRRAKAAKMIEEKVVAKHGGLFNPRLACGGQDDWAGFSGFYDFLSNSYLEKRMAADTVAFNLYAASFPGRVGLIR